MFESTARGRVENISDEPVSVSIKITFFSLGEPACDKTVNLGRIEPGQTVRYAATCLSAITAADAYTYEIIIE